jgi:antitoxin VapB
VPASSFELAMALNIKDAETDRLARRLSALTGESITVAVKNAVRQRIEREERERASVEELLAIAKRIASRIDRDGRTADEIIGYDERGLPR